MAGMTRGTPPVDAPLDVAGMRERLVDRIWLGWLLVAILGWPTSLVRILSTGWQPVFAIHTTLAVTVIGLYLQRHRLSTECKIAAATALPFLIGIPALLDFGFYSAGLLWLVMGCLVAALFFPRRHVIVLLLAEAAFLSLVAWGFVSGRLVAAVDGDSYVHSADAWLGLLVGTLTASIAVVLAIQQYNRSMTELITTVTTQRDVIYHHAMHDALTGLPSLRLARDRLAQACAQASRNGGCLALMFIDLDHFKAVNDSHGHDAGDAVLKAIAQRLESAVRENDTAARLGGDEFLVLMVGLETPDAARSLAARLLPLLCQPVHYDNATLVVGASIGIAVYPDHADTPEQLLKRADEAMYRVKDSARSGWQMWAPDIGQSRLPAAD